MDNPLISIIIPCFNSGAYLSEAIESVEINTDKSIYEIVIINDGSTDKETLELLSAMELKGYKVLHQENKGPGAARNTGIKNALGKYVLFLDSDNKISAEYIPKGLAILENNPNIGIVYAKAIFFGEETGSRFETKEFDLPSILAANYIDMCSIVRKNLFEQLGGFDENRLLIGHEDWDLWIRAGAEGIQFHLINEALFYYRIRKDSLVKKALLPENHTVFIQYFYTKHQTILLESLNYLLVEKRLNSEKYLVIKKLYGDDIRHPLRSFFKFFYNKYIKKESFN